MATQNNKLWIGIGIIALIIFLIPQMSKESKKMAGEIVKFRTSDLTYGSGNIISFNTNCDGSNLTQYTIDSAKTLLNSCNTWWSTDNIITNLPGKVSADCVSTTSFFYNIPLNRYNVCFDLDDSGVRSYQIGYKPLYTSTPPYTLQTETSSSIDPTREVSCGPSITIYQTFIVDKNDYIDGILDTPTFTTKANEWITSI